MSDSGKSGNNRRHRQRFSKRKNDRHDGHRHEQKKHNFLTEGKFDKIRAGAAGASQGNMQQRLRWTAPVLPKNPTSTPDCPWCGKPIREIASAMSDKESGAPVHFECVLERISNMEKPEKNHSVCYIGGGRFGLIHYNNPSHPRSFMIKKIYEWEVKENHIEWRKPFSEYFSIT